MPSDFRRFVLALAAFTVLPPLSIGAFIIAVDPAYVFGSPSWPHVNAVRPYCSRDACWSPSRTRCGAGDRPPSPWAIPASKSASSPRHRGWIDTNAFNFAMPLSNSYAVMLAFLHAQRVGAPLKQAVVGFDFFGSDISTSDLGAGDGWKRRVRPTASAASRPVPGRKTCKRREAVHPRRARNCDCAGEPGVDRALYIAVDADGAAAIVAAKEFASGRQHYEYRIGGTPASRRRARCRQTGMRSDMGSVDIRMSGSAIAGGCWFLSGYHQYLVVGHSQGRLGGFEPADWNEERYLAANPDARNRAGPGRLPDRLSALCSGSA